jgi:hypothetical protein
MRERFEVGEVAILVRVADRAPGEVPKNPTVPVGTEVIVVQGLKWSEHPKIDGPQCVYGIQAPNGHIYIAPPHWLKKKRPPGEETVKWEDCVWRPSIKETA